MPLPSITRRADDKTTSNLGCFESKQPEAVSEFYFSDSSTYDPDAAPNISINLHRGASTRELVIVTLCGIILQVGMVVFTAFTVYHPI